jgi:hypothetical protein
MAECVLKRIEPQIFEKNFYKVPHLDRPVILTSKGIGYFFPYFRMGRDLMVCRFQPAVACRAVDNDIEVRLPGHKQIRSRYRRGQNSIGLVCGRCAAAGPATEFHKLDSQGAGNR